MRTQENFSFVYCEPETARDFDACLLSAKNQVESQVTFGGKPLDDAHRTTNELSGHSQSPNPHARCPPNRRPSSLPIRLPGRRASAAQLGARSGLIPSLIRQDR